LESIVSITRGLENRSFGPETVKAMGVVFDDVCRQLGLTGKSEATQLIASKLIELASRAEYDQEGLRTAALKAFWLDRCSGPSGF
jgi:hypothetical protein